MTDLGHKIAADVKEMATWKETWIPFALGAIVLWVIFILSMMVTVRDTIIRQMSIEMQVVERQVDGLKAQAAVMVQEAEARKIENIQSKANRIYITERLDASQKTIKESQAATSKEIKYLHEELDNTRAALKRLEARK